MSLTRVGNILTWDRAILVATTVAGQEIDFAKLLLAVIHERAFKTSNTYPFQTSSSVVQGCSANFAL